MKEGTKNLGFKDYFLSKRVDFSQIEAQRKKIEDYKNGEYADFINQFLKVFNSLINLDYVEKSDKLENVDYGDFSKELRDIKYALITNSGILAFELTKDIRARGNKQETFAFKNNTEFRNAMREILKNHRKGIKIISYDELEKFYQKKGLLGKLNAYQLPARFYDNDTNLVFINPMTNEFKILPNKNHMLALEIITNLAKEAKNNSGIKLTPKLLERINGVMFKGTEMEGQTGIGKFRETNVTVGYPPYWETIVFREVAKRDDLGNIKGYNNSQLIKEIKELLDFCNNDKNLSPVERAAIINLEISRMQPFRDGNKRLARLMTNYELLKHGYPTIAFRSNGKEDYDQRLRRCINSKDAREFVEYLNDMIYQQQNIYLKEFDIMKYYLEEDNENTLIYNQDVEDEEEKQ